MTNRMEGTMSTVLGYGRYKDDPKHLGCPRAKSDMTPCIARDGHIALADSAAGPSTTCVGCGAAPLDLLNEMTVLAEDDKSLSQDEWLADSLEYLVKELTRHLEPQ